MSRPVRVRIVTLSAAFGLGLSACSTSANVRAMPSVVGRNADTQWSATSGAVPSNSLHTPAPPATGLASDVPLVASSSAGASEALTPIAVIDGGPNGLSVGSKSPAVAALENRLTNLRFDAGKADGVYDAPLFQAVMAFQKQQGLARTGKADAQTLAAVSTAAIGAAMVATGEATRVEIDLKRQVAQFWTDGRLVRVIPVSSGNGAHYCIPKDKGGGCDTAITPGGSYRADRKIEGDHESPLGHLYDPVFFNGGIAIHGSASVPAGPASHGCVRVPMWESRWVYDNVAIGEPVYVVGGTVTPVPFGVTAPTDGTEVTAPPSAPAA